MRFNCLLFITLILLSLTFSHSNASVNIDINDEVYELLSKLEAEGLIKSSLLATKPLNRKEIIRLILEAENNSENESAFIKNIISVLKKQFDDEFGPENYLKPVDRAYGKYIHTDSGDSRHVYNNDGITYKKGVNLHSGITSNAGLSWASFQFNPEIRYSDDDTDILINKAYVTASAYGLELEIGKDSQWWGPGHHGAILLSNNAEPLKIFKITNSKPLVLPSVLKYLGLVKFVYFTTVLENDRVVSNPYLWGLRINVKPNPYFELGLNRTAMLGGEGRSKDIKTWIKSFTGRGENTYGVEAGDQRAGFDLKLTLPFDWQPVQLYAEWAGEDEARGLPSKWAYLSGIYLPRILYVERLGFRFEYATTHIKGHPNVWYDHHIYKSGYTYKGRIIGHHMGTDSEDFFFEMSYLLPGVSHDKITMSYDYEKSNLSEEINETSQELSLKLDLPIKKPFEMQAGYTYGQIKNLANIQGINEKVNILSVDISYKF